MRLQFGVRGLRQRAVPLHLLSVLRVTSVCLGHWMWGCLHNKGITFSQRWPSTCLPNEFDIGMDTLSGGSLGESAHSRAVRDDSSFPAVNQTAVHCYGLRIYTVDLLHIITVSSVWPWGTNGSSSVWNARFFYQHVLQTKHCYGSFVTGINNNTT